MNRKNSSLMVLALIMLVNALAYGTIIPLLYPYAARFGINPLGLSFLFASFSLAQFIATPILGRLSDEYGRKPVLLICLLGTSASLALFASAHNVLVLFIARIVDGFTGGNVSVAQAMIADSTNGQERAKSFALLGAAFGVGFTFGPALGGLMGNYGLTAPFWFSAVLALVGTFLGAIILKETLPANYKNRKVKKDPIFDPKALIKAIVSPITGILILIGFLTAIAQFAFFIGLQSYTNDVLKLNPSQIGIMFTIIGIVNILAQAFGIRALLSAVHSKKKIIVVSLIASVITMTMLFFQNSLWPFIGALILFATALSPIGPVLAGLLSERTSGEDQGIILGINQSYTSLAQIIGPLLAGFVAAKISVGSIFLLASCFLVFSLISCKWMYNVPKHKLNI